MRLLVARQEFSADEPTPAIKLPGFALITQLKDPQTMRPELKRIFQSLIGFLNISGAMNGQPQLDLDMQVEGDQQYFSAKYVREVDRRETAAVPIQYTFSPSLAFVGDVAILSSTMPLAKQVVSQLAATPAVPAESRGVNTEFEVDFEGVRISLEDNFKQLVSQNMLQDGHTQEEAEAEIGTLLSVLELLQRASLELSFDNQATFAATVSFAE